MKTRRTFLSAIGSVSALAAISHSGASQAAAGCTTFDKKLQENISPDEALQRLKDGNTRFTNGLTVNCDLLAQVNATASGQYPFAAIVGCIDSRVPPELVFDQRLGDIFAARIAGNFVNTDIIGSLEFATKVAGAKLIVVLGHSECGAVKGAVDDVKLGNLTATLSNIRPSVLKVKNVSGDLNSKNKKYVQAVADQNAKDAATLLVERSEVLRDLVAQKQLKIVSAMHDISTGKISWL